MAALVFLLALTLAMTGHSNAAWCVCKEGLSDSVLQKTLDYACGAGADCNPIHSSGTCYNPNTVKAHCNYAVNSYFQRKGQGQGTCDFAGTATISTSDPSVSGCSYPSSASNAGSTTTSPTSPVTSTTPSTTTPSTTTPSTTTPSTNTPTTGTTTTSPYTTTPSNGVLGGVGTGVGPSGAGGVNTDYSDGGLGLRNSIYLSLTKALFLSGLMLLWG